MDGQFFSILHLLVCFIGFHGRFLHRIFFHIKQKLWVKSNFCITWKMRKLGRTKSYLRKWFHEKLSNQTPRNVEKKNFWSQFYFNVVIILLIRIIMYIRVSYDMLRIQRSESKRYTFLLNGIKRLEFSVSFQTSYSAFIIWHSTSAFGYSNVTAKVYLLKKISLRQNCKCTYQRNHNFISSFTKHKPESNMHTYKHQNLKFISTSKPNPFSLHLILST